MVSQNLPKLWEILNEKQVDYIINSSVGRTWQLLRCDMRPVADGLSGFLGDHAKLVLHVQSKGEIKIVNLFVKRLPVENKPKADFIDTNNYFRREELVYRLSEEFKWMDGANPWGVKAYIYTDSIVVLPDLSAQGYVSCDLLETFDLPHLKLVVTAVARFHADFANFETKKSINGKPYSVFQEYGYILTEPSYKDSPWLHAASKLTQNLLIEFSEKYKSLTDIKHVLSKLYIEACDSLKEYKDTLNVLIHKDLWTNNIMFKYKDGNPTDAKIIDYQCIRYGPPAFDLMILLYLTTTRKFREENEVEVLRHYYNTFLECIEEETKVKLKGFGYDIHEFLCWCERGRMFAMFEAIGILPYVLMDPKSAEKVFDDPDTYEKLTTEDRTEPVIAYSNQCKEYKERNMEVSEEFIERYVLCQIS